MNTAHFLCAYSNPSCPMPLMQGRNLCDPFLITYNRTSRVPQHREVATTHHHYGLSDYQNKIAIRADPAAP